MDDKFEVVNTKSHAHFSFATLEDAELWIAEQENSSEYEIVPVAECHSPMNLFLSHGMLTRNKK